MTLLKHELTTKQEMVRAFALALAHAQLGTRENPNNWGSRVSQFLAAVGWNKPAPWCAAFVIWCTDKAAKSRGAKAGIKRTASCTLFRQWAKRRGFLIERPTPGDIFILWRTVEGVMRPAHMGFVLDVRSDSFTTVEGNSNNDGSREGKEVVTLRRSFGGDTEFIAWAKAVS
jgi:hypothetical protein